MVTHSTPAGFTQSDAALNDIMLLQMDRPHIVAVVSNSSVILEPVLLLLLLLVVVESLLCHGSSCNT
jgi:hypothetical protein